MGLANILSGVDLDRGLLGIFSENFIQLYVEDEKYGCVNLNYLMIPSDGLRHSVKAL